jgi:hypothetical protein
MRVMPSNRGDPFETASLPLLSHVDRTERVEQRRHAIKPFALDFPLYGAGRCGVVEQGEPVAK